MQRTTKVKKLSNLIRRKLTTVGKGSQTSHYQILAFINSREHTYQRDIDIEFSLQRPTTTEILGLMEKKGFITKKGSDTDKRLKEILITRKGKETLEGVLPYLKEIDSNFIEGISKQDLKVFDKVIDIMISNGEGLWCR